MSREIKFRVWDEKYMDYDVWVNSNGAFGEPDKKYNTPNIEINPYSKNAIIMQFTGLHDKNGKEIYEGDYYQVANNKIYTIKWLTKGESNHELYAATFILWLNEETFFPMDEWALKNGEVIGNIYENEYLLNG